MSLEFKSYAYEYFSIETTDISVFNRIIQRINLPLSRTWIDIGSNKEKRKDYFCTEIEGRNNLILALEEENGEYSVYSKKDRRIARNELIYVSFEKN